MVGPTIGVIASVPSIVSARIFVAISGIAVAVVISGMAVAAAATRCTTAPAPSRFRRSWKCHCGRGDGDHSRSSENKFSEFWMHMFFPFLGLRKADGYPILRSRHEPQHDPTTASSAAVVSMSPLSRERRSGAPGVASCNLTTCGLPRTIKGVAENQKSDSAGGPLSRRGSPANATAG